MFVKPMREKRCMTMLDPFYVKYGKLLTAGLSLMSIFMDLFWFPTTLIGLGMLTGLRNDSTAATNLKCEDLWLTPCI